MNKRELDTVGRKNSLQCLLDGLLSMKTNPDIGHSLNGKQRSRYKLIIARKTNEPASEIDRRGHYAASSRPSSNAAWITVP